MDNMKREIRFRVFDGHKMNYEPCVWMGKEYLPLSDSFVEADIQQFIGLKDANGKDIYEGDNIGFTIKFSDDRCRAYWSEDGFIGTVVYEKQRFTISNVVFNKMFDADYVFSMQGRSFDRDLLERYSIIKKASFDEISNIVVI
jgi:uncharacterized phage protein (TIGR01671 family)